MDESKKNNDKNNKKQYLLLAILTILIIVLAGIVYFFMINTSKVEDKELAYTELINEINEENIEKIEMSVGSTTAKVKLKGVEEEKTTIIPSTQAFIELIQQKFEDGNEFEFIQKPTNIFVKLSTTLFSLLIAI